MDNITMSDLLPTEDVTEIGQHVPEIPTTVNPYLWNTTGPSTPAPYNTTQTNLTAADGSVEHEVSLTVLWMYFAVRILWGGLAIFGNGMTIFAVIKFERLQTCTNYLICSLAVSDLLSILTIPLIIVYELYPNSWFFIPTCLIQKTFSIISSGGNLLNIMYLSIDRYIYIAFPLRYHSLVTPQKIVIILTSSWMSCLIGTPTMIFTANHLQLGMPCQYHIFLHDWVRKFYLAPQFMLVVLLTIGFHFAIAKIAHNQARQIHAEQQPYNTLNVAISQSTKKTCHTLGIVLGVYLFSYLPQLLLTAPSVVYNTTHPKLVTSVRFATLFYWANTWVNPLIYAWRLKDFRIAFKKIFTGTGSFNEVPGIIG